MRIFDVITSGRFALAVFLCLALLGDHASAAIGVLDAPSPTPAVTGTTTAISASATVSLDANVLVVLLTTRGGSTAYSDPATLSWNGQTLNRVVTATDGVSTFRNASIYYLFNPTPGTANVTGTGATGTSFWALKSYTLSGVDTNVSPLTGSAGGGIGTTTLSFNIANCPGGGLAAVCANWSTVTDTISFSGTGGTPTTTSEYFSAASGNDIGMGYIAGVSAGTDTFTATVGGTGNKSAFVAAVFTPASCTLPGVPGNPSATGQCGSVLLNWTASSPAATRYKVYRSTASGVYGAALATGIATTNYADGSAIPGTNYFYKVTGVDSGCESDLASSPEVSGSALPSSVTANAGVDRTAYGYAATLAGNTPGAGTGTWTRISGPGAVTFSPNANTPGATATVTAGGTNVFRWTLTNGACTSFDDVQVIYQTAVTVVDAPSAVGSGATANISQSVTVSPEANVLVVLLADKGASGAAPLTLSWNGQTLTRAVTAVNTTSTFREASIYYLFYPTLGTANVTGTLNGATDWALQSYSLANVDPTVLPLTAARSANSGTTLSAGIANVISNSCAAVCANWSAASNMSLTITGTGGTPVTTNAYPESPNSSGSQITMGYVSGLSAGTDTFTATAEIGNKCAFTVAVFSQATACTPPTVPGSPTATPQLGSIQLNWTASSPAGTVYNVYRSTVSGSYGAPLAINVATTNYTDYSGTLGTTYYYKITGVKGLCESDIAASPQVSAAPLFTPPSITTQPQSQSAVVGQNPVFFVVASGSAPFSYQWYFNTNTPVANATNSFLILNNVQLANAGGYRVVVTNGGGAVTSAVATLTVNSTTTDPLITQQPASLTAYVGVTTSLTVQATGTSPFRFQWYFNASTALVNATNATLTFTNIQLANAGSYTVRVTNSVGTVFSDTVTLTVLPVLAFPGAEGFGKYALGGRGGDVYIVTNLNDSGPGSFRNGLANVSGPRTIVFNVSGIINFTNELYVSGLTNFTVAGQTAPGKGITFKSNDKGFSVNGCRNFVWRYVKFRSGPDLTGVGGNDCLTTEDGAGGTTDFVDQWILDHCSLSWGVDGNMDLRTIQNYTVQWCLFYEALNDSTHYKLEPHGMCTSQRGLIGNGCNHHNLYASSRDRHPSFGGDNTIPEAILDYRNCVVYNWGLDKDLHPNITSDADGFTRFFGCNYNVINNYYRRGPELGIGQPLSPRQDTNSSIQMVYFGGNKFTGYPAENDSWAVARNSNVKNAIDYGFYDGGAVEFTNNHLLTQPINLDGFTPQTHSADQAYELVLLKGGASSLRDNADAAFIRSVRNNTGRVIDTVEQSAAGGWDTAAESRPAGWDTDRDGIPNYWELAMGMNTNVANNNHYNSDGYTDLEHYLNWLADPHAVGGKNMSVDVNMRTLYGDTNSLTFTVTNPTNGTVSMLPGGDMARFTPAANFIGLAGFDFYATNAATGVDFGPLTVGLLITNSTALPTAYSQPVGAFVGFTNGQCLWLISGDSGPSYIIQASTNLVNWTGLFTNHSAELPFLWTDVDASNYTRRFYRVILGP